MSGDYTYTVTAQNAETGLMASGWTAPDGMATVTVGGDPVSLTPSGETWLGAWTVPENTPAGNVPVAAEIAATSNYNAANASPAVTDKGAVTATLTPSAGSVTYGDSVTLTASVTKADPDDPDSLTGTAQFYLDAMDDAHKLGQPQDVTGALSVTLERDRLTAGNHTVYAVYEGNGDFAAAQAQAEIRVDLLTLGWDASELTASRSQAQGGEAAVYGTLRLTGVWRAIPSPSPPIAGWSPWACRASPSPASTRCGLYPPTVRIALTTKTTPCPPTRPRSPRSSTPPPRRTCPPRAALS